MRRAAAAALTRLLALHVGSAAAIGGQARSCVLADDTRPWAPPLDRRVAQPVAGLALRDALDRVAAAAGVRLSYATESVPLDREACTLATAAPLGAVLRALLVGVAVAPVPGGATQVVLAPGLAAPPLAPRTTTLDRVVVTGSVAGAPQRMLPYALDVVAVREHRGSVAPTLATLLDGAVPGLWLWHDAPTALQVRVGSLRGASSFGATAPKVFVDGVELANPLLLTRLPTDAIERIEVIRGPQGAALYGADAISGVVNVQLRHDAAPDGRRAIAVRSGAGASATAFAADPALVHEHAATVRLGDARRSGSAVATVQATGGAVPGAQATHLALDGQLRAVDGARTTTAMASVRAARAASGTNPLLAASSSAGPGGVPTAGDQQLVHYTLGTTTTRTTAVRTDAITVGLDGYRLDGLTVDAVPIPSALDSAARAARGGADRATVRASRVRRFGLGGAIGTSVTGSIDGGLLRDATVSAIAPPRPGEPGAAAAVAPRWLGTVGTGAQVAVLVHDRVLLSAGLRGEYNGGFTTASRFALLPALGATWHGDVGAWRWALRGAYGEGMRPARSTVRSLAWQGGGFGPIAADLAPERQAGVEVGVDLAWRDRFALQLTRFDQRASSLIQQVAIATTTPAGAPTGDRRRIAYRLENVGVIANRGWELSLRAAHGAVAAQGSLALVASDVARVAAGYTGDLRAGDRMLGVPARTAGLTLTWAPRGWAVQGGIVHVADWIGYDRLAIATDWATGGAPARTLTGEALRGYWLGYSGATRLRAAVERSLARGITLRVTGENLGDRQRGEPDNTTIVAGRTLSIGFGARF